MSLGFGSLWRVRLPSVVVSRQSPPLASRTPSHARLATPSVASSRSYRNRYQPRPRHHSKTQDRHKEVRSAADSKLEGQNWKKILAREEATTEKQPGKDFQTGPKHARNTFYREAFRSEGPAINQAISDMMQSPYVPAPYKYPSEEATASSQRHALRVARIQVGFDVLAYHRHYAVPSSSRVLARLKRLSVTTERPDMAAMRVLLPKSWDLALSPETVKYIESTTGLLTKLRVTPDYQQLRSIILRGKKSSLARAADELVAASSEIEVFQLGNVSAISYDQKQLWPVIDGALEDGALLPPDHLDSLWAHQELVSYWIDTPYEMTPKPTDWTKENFQTYITTLVCGRLHSHLVMPLYAQSRPNGSMGVDADGIRVKLIMEAFENPDVRPCITLPVLKMALNFLSSRGGHRMSATRLFYLADKYGIAMDTDVFNILLNGYVIKRDAWHFHNTLRMMRTRFFRANSWTWLLFLRLVEKAEERRQIIVAIFEAGLFDDLAMRREVAAAMVPHDAYTAFTAGRSLDAFIENQVKLYGQDWLTNESQHALVQELLRFHRPNHDRLEEVKQVFAMRLTDGRPIKIETINHILGWCVPTKNWSLALWTLKEAAERGIETDHRTYDKIIRLALMARSPTALSIAFFYAILDRKLQGSTRVLMRDVLLEKFRHGFWVGRNILIGTKDMTRQLSWKENRVKNENDLVNVIEQYVLKECVGLEEKPEKPLWYMLSFALRKRDGPLHSRIKRGQEGAERPWTTIIKLKGPSGSGKRNLRFEGVFKPEQIMEDWGMKRQGASGVATGPRISVGLAYEDALREYDEAEPQEEDLDMVDYAEEAALFEQFVKEGPIDGEDPVEKESKEDLEVSRGNNLPLQQQGSVTTSNSG